MLTVENLSYTFGALKAVDGVSLEVAQGSLVGLIGPNGAGKSTLFELVAGTLPVRQGRITFNARSIEGMAPDERARRGLIRTFQVPHEFARMPVWENVMTGARDQMGERLLAVWFQGRRIRHEEEALRERAHAMLERVGLAGKAHLPAGQLSGGQKKLLELARALMAGPKCLLLDEPVAGVSPSLEREIADLIRGLVQEGLTFFIIEHNMPFLLGLVDHVYLMARGRILLDGPPEQVRADPTATAVYMGEEPAVRRGGG